MFRVSFIIIAFLLFIPIASAEIVKRNGTDHESNWNSSAMVDTRLWDSSNPDKYPYWFTQTATHWLFYKDNDNLALQKNIIDVVYTEPHKISFEIHTTKGQIVTKSIANVTGERYIPIPNPLLKTRFLFDDKKPDVLIDNGTAQWYANESTYWYSKVNGQIRFNFQTAPYLSLNLTDNITIVFDSYVVFNGSTIPSWRNTSFDDNTTINKGSSNIEALNWSDNFNDNNGDWTIWGDSNSVSYTERKMSMTGNGSYFYVNYNQQGFYYSGKNLTNFSVQWTGNITTNDYMLLYFRASNFSPTTTMGYVWFIDINDTVDSISHFRKIINAVATTIGTDSIITPDILIRSTHEYRLVVNGSMFRIYVDDVLQDTEVNADYTSGKIAFSVHYVSGNNIWFADNVQVRLVDALGNPITLGNSTHWNDFGTGRQGANLMFNFTNASGLFIDAYASTDNFTTSNVLVASNITNATWIAIPASAKNQTQYVRAVLKGNLTSTPELMEVSIEDEVAGAPPAEPTKYTYTQRTKYYRRE